MTNKPLSIITNFGCDEKCEYCIWKKHPLRYKYTSYKSVDWYKLNEQLKSLTNKKISISGGGDPLFNLSGNMEFYNELFHLCNKYQLLIDMHTSKYIKDIEFLKHFNKIVLHVNKDFNLKEIYKFYNKNNIKLRFVVVLDKEVNLSKVKQYISLAKKMPEVQFSFREVYLDEKPNDIDDILKYIRKKESDKIKYIQQNDYNIYFMPDNNVTDTFIEME